jgi:hypothetical protein
MHGHEQWQDLQSLLYQGEPGQPPRQCQGNERQQGVGQRMLTKKRALVHVHQQTAYERSADANAAWLVHGPECQRQRQQIGQRGVAAQGQQVEGQRGQQRQRDEKGVDRQQQLVGPTRHDHDAAPGSGGKIMALGPLSSSGVRS